MNARNAPATRPQRARAVHPIRIRLDPPVDIDMPDMRLQREEDMPKGAYVKKHHFEEFGYTEDCEGCRRLRSGVVRRRPHLESCRRRIYNELAKTRKLKEMDGECKC